MKTNAFISAILNSGPKRKALLLAIDVSCYSFVSVLYLLFSSLGTSNMGVFGVNTAIHVVLIFVLRALFRVYKNVWRYSNTMAYLAILVSDGLASALTVGATYGLGLAVRGMYIGVWRALSVGSLTALLTLASRFCYSILYKRRKNSRNEIAKEPVAIIGAGRLGTYLAGDLRNNPNSHYQPVFFVDTDSLKIDYRVSGLKVYDPETAQKIIHKNGVKTVIIAITHGDSDAISKLYTRYSDLGCKVKICESLGIADGTGNKPNIREFTIEDLLFRKTIDINKVAMFIVLVIRIGSVGFQITVFF